jgi:pentapeptide MXKDX repeat protein
MNRAFSSIAFAAAILFGGHALADDSMTRADMTKRQLMNDCMEKQKATDVTMSKTQMKRFCKDQLKQQKASGAFPEPPPVDTPHN